VKTTLTLLGLALLIACSPGPVSTAPAAAQNPAEQVPVQSAPQIPAAPNDSGEPLADDAAAQDALQALAVPQAAAGLPSVQDSTVRLAGCRCSR